MHALLPDDGEVAGLLALMLLTEARRPARTTEAGELVPLAEQDRSLWRSVDVQEGVALVTDALTRTRPGPYQLQAAIAAVHDEAPSAAQTDWAQVLALYEMLATTGCTPCEGTCSRWRGRPNSPGRATCSRHSSRRASPSASTSNAGPGASESLPTTEGVPRDASHRVQRVAAPTGVDRAGARCSSPADRECALSTVRAQLTAGAAMSSALAALSWAAWVAPSISSG